MEVSVSSLPQRCWVSDNPVNERLRAGSDDIANRREDGTEDPEQDIAIKKVLQDKRFKVGLAPKRLN